MKKTNKKLIGIILIISLFMCIGYAEVSDTILNITGEIEATAQDGVFISEVVTNNADSVINFYIGTMLDSKIVLENSTSSIASYNITIFNNSGAEQVFIGVLTNDYSNTNIDYTLTGLTDKLTVIGVNESLTFTITFKYAGTDTSNNILESKLNFRFREVPRIDLSNDGEIYTLENIYPGYTPKEYQFTLTNKEENKINNVEMKYDFETTIDSPLKAKIYDVNGKEVIESIIINGEGQTEINNKYILKIIFDENSNSTAYANKEYSCNIKLKAVPIDTDYAEYNITKEFNVRIKTAPFYLNTILEETDIKLTNNEALVGLTIKNYNSSSEYNKYETKYEIGLEDTSKYTITATDSNSGIIKRGANTNNVTIKFVPVEGVILNVEEQVTLIVKTTSPYAYTNQLNTITIKNKKPVETVTITSETGENIVEKNGILQLTATVLPEDATNKEVIWTSSDNNIATVDNTGLVTGISAGNVTITAEADGVMEIYEMTVSKVLINFRLIYTTFRGTTILYELFAEKGMTWLDWVESEYNTCGAEYNEIPAATGIVWKVLSFNYNRVERNVQIDQDQDGNPDIIQDGCDYEVM